MKEDDPQVEIYKYFKLKKRIDFREIIGETSQTILIQDLTKKLKEGKVCCAEKVEEFLKSAKVLEQLKDYKVNFIKELEQNLTSLSEKPQTPDCITLYNDEIQYIVQTFESLSSQNEILL